MKYIVLEKDGFTGLTVGNRVLKPGSMFDETSWPYGQEALEAAVKNERCKEVEEQKPVKPAVKVEPESDVEEQKKGGRKKQESAE